MYKRLLSIVASCSLLLSCGGGGGSPASVSPSYTGLTTQATVTTANAKALSADAYTGSQIASSASGVAKVTGGNSPSPLLQETARILEQSVTASVAAPKSSAKDVAATAQNTINGFSGSFSFSINYDPNTGSFNGTGTFSLYKETSNSVTLSGSIAFSGVYSQATDTFPSMNISMSSLTGTDGSTSYSLAGSLSYVSISSTNTITMSVVLSDNVSGRTYWVRDFTLTLVQALTGDVLTVTGTYYDPAYGYVVVSTVVPLAVSAVDAMPTAGQLLFTGSNGTKARLTFDSVGYVVEADTAGTGTFVVVP